MADPIPESVQDILLSGEITLEGEFLWGSNYTFLVKLHLNEYEHLGVYKPTRGERPLWDFPPDSLALREVAAYLVSEAIGWRFVPPTVYRQEGPIGPGSLQWYIEHDPEYHYFNFSDEDRLRLAPVVLFDLLINNADRKGSHVMVGGDNRLWLIDHGVCFHVEEKLRTVIWEFGGQRIPVKLLNDLEKLCRKLSPPSALVDDLQKYLDDSEIAALARRAERLIGRGRFPNPPSSRRSYPWPPI